MPTPANERLTENIVREQLRGLNYFDQNSDIRVEEQKSNIEEIRRLLKSAGKSGQGGTGSPEFIITSPSDPDLVVIIECKARIADLVSPFFRQRLADATEEDATTKHKRIQRFAVDGALHYARRLSKEYNVIAVGVAGEVSANAAFSAYLFPKGGRAPKEFVTKDGHRIVSLIPWSDFVEHASFDPTIQRMRFDELMAFARELHEFMRDHAKLTESEKPLLVSGTLIALRNPAFSLSFGSHTPEELQREWMKVIQNEIAKAEIPQAKKDNMTQPYSSIAVHPELGKATRPYPKGVLHELILRLREKVWPFIGVYHDFDVVGQFYGEFLKYTGGDKKGLGIVLTPRHITELFALIANVHKDSKVLDICAGTGGFLVSAMHQMMKDAVTSAEKRRIRRDGLIGVEQQPNMFALAASNMILRGDGKANLYQGSCFDRAIANALKRHHASVGMLNPPFSQSDADLHELRFIRHMLDSLEAGAIGIAITPMSCAIAPHTAREELLRHHTLEAVMSMPDELFYPVGVITCIMVFKAHHPHGATNRKTWFGYWKDDGFRKTKNRGRADIHETWANIRDRWVEMFRNREVHPGESVMQRVTHENEWCAEAYMQTDYARITPEQFEEVLKDYAIFKLLGAQTTSSQEETAND
jgi:type I restriction enzyme M protein